jgi:hypothetical protein
MNGAVLKHGGGNGSTPEAVKQAAGEQASGK